MPNETAAAAEALEDDEVYSEIEEVSFVASVLLGLSLLADDDPFSPLIFLFSSKLKNSIV